MPKTWSNEETQCRCLYLFNRTKEPCCMYYLFIFIQNTFCIRNLNLQKFLYYKSYAFTWNVLVTTTILSLMFVRKYIDDVNLYSVVWSPDIIKCWIGNNKHLNPWRDQDNNIQQHTGQHLTCQSLSWSLKQCDVVMTESRKVGKERSLSENRNNGLAVRGRRRYIVMMEMELLMIETLSLDHIPEVLSLMLLVRINNLWQYLKEVNNSDEMKLSKNIILANPWKTYKRLLRRIVIFLVFFTIGIFILGFILQRKDDYVM